MRTTVERIIGGSVFAIGQLNGRKATCLAGLAYKGATLGLLNLSSAEMNELLTNFLPSVLVDGKPLEPVYDTMMQGRQMQALELIKACIEENFGDFFVEAPAPALATPADPPSAG
jgi:hypothetical protein